MQPTYIIHLGARVRRKSFPPVPALMRGIGNADELVGYVCDASPGMALCHESYYSLLIKGSREKVSLCVFAP